MDREEIHLCEKLVWQTAMAESHPKLRGTVTHNTRNTCNLEESGEDHAPQYPPSWSWRIRCSTGGKPWSKHQIAF